jgi:hypothetical protein
MRFINHTLGNENKCSRIVTTAIQSYKKKNNCMGSGAG